MRTMKTILTLAILTGMTACSDAGRRNLDEERGNRTYQAAMADYAAGRLKEAIDGLEKVLRADPGNTSARFQLACLQQDKLNDYLAAICNYREYILQSPGSEKVSIARERSAICERQLVSVLSKKMNLTDSAGLVDENARLKGENKKLSDENRELKKTLEEVRGKFASTARDNENLRRLISSVGSEDEKSRPTLLPSDRDLLDDDGADDLDKAKFAADVKGLLDDESHETTDTPFKVTEKKTEAKLAATEPPHEPRPKTYVVQDGDTLYKLAVRFYGVRSAWTKIRDANKTEISTDGRVRAGQTIRLP